MTADEQRLAALRRANDARSARADWKRGLRAVPHEHALDSARWHLLVPPWWIETMPVFDVLTALPRIGPSKAREILRAGHVGRTRRVGELVPRERAAVAGWLEERIGAVRERSVAA